MRFLLALLLLVAATTPGRAECVNASVDSAVQADGFRKPVKFTVCADAARVTVHEKEGSPVLASLPLALAKGEQLSSKSLYFIGYGFIEIVNGKSKRGVLFEYADASKFATVWTSPTCTDPCLQAFSYRGANPDNDWVDYTYEVYPRPAAKAKSTDLVKVQRFRVRDRMFKPYLAVAEVTLDDWFRKTLICSLGSPLCPKKK